MIRWLRAVRELADAEAVAFELVRRLLGPARDPATGLRLRPLARAEREAHDAAMAALLEAQYTAWSTGGIDNGAHDLEQPRDVRPPSEPGPPTAVEPT